MVAWTSERVGEEKQQLKTNNAKNAPDSPTSTLEQCGSAKDSERIASKGRLCMTVNPSRDEFSRPFTEYVQSIFKQNPDCPCFRVVPPKGWKPRKGDYDF